MIDPLVLTYTVYYLGVLYLWTIALSAKSKGVVENDEFKIITLSALGWPILSIVMIFMALFKVDLGNGN